MSLISIVSFITHIVSTPPSDAQILEKAEKDYSLCISYLEGFGGKIDYPKAFPLCKSAAEAGVRDAQFNLGVMYMNGEGTPKSKIKAIEWYRKAAAQYHAIAAVYASDLDIDDGHKKDLELAHDLLQARLWQNEPEDYFLFGVNLRRRAVDDAGQKDAMQYFKKASDLGHGRAAFALALSYQGLQKGLDKDLEQAVRFYKLASDRGVAEASTNLANMYHEGMGVPVDEVEMLKYLELGAARGDSLAQFLLGGLYLKGDHPKVAPKNYEKSFYYLTEAVKGKHVEAMRMLSEMYRDGKGVERDIANSKELFEAFKAENP